MSIKVDVADRCRGPIEALASTYTVDARSDDLIDASPSIAAWELWPDRLTFAATEPAQVSLAEAGRRATQIQALAALTAVRFPRIVHLSTCALGFGSPVLTIDPGFFPLGQRSTSWIS